MPTVPYTLEQAELDIAELRGDVDGLNEVHTVADGALTPNTPAAGEFALYSTSGLPSYVNDSGLQMGVAGAQTAFFPLNTVTSASLANVASGTYTGGDASVGSIYELEVWGNGQQGSPAETLEVACVFGGTTLTNLLFGTTAIASTPAGVVFRFRFVVRVVCITTGVSGTWQSFVRANLTNASGAAISAGNSNMAEAVACEAATTTVVDTTVNEALACKAAWGNATTGCTLTSRVAFFKRVC